MTILIFVRHASLVYIVKWHLFFLYEHSNSQLLRVTTFKLFPSVCASQILWKFVPNCWSAHEETAAAKPSGLCAWDDDVTMVGWSQSQTSSNGVYNSVHITKVLRTSAARTVERHQDNFEGDALWYRQPVENVTQCRCDVLVASDAGDRPRGSMQDWLQSSDDAVVGDSVQKTLNGKTSCELILVDNLTKH